jgi:hypothetical protein
MNEEIFEKIEKGASMVFTWILFIIFTINFSIIAGSIVIGAIKVILMVLGVFK